MPPAWFTWSNQACAPRRNSRPRPLLIPVSATLCPIVMEDDVTPVSACARINMLNARNRDRVALYSRLIASSLRSAPELARRHDAFICVISVQVIIAKRCRRHYPRSTHHLDHACVEKQPGGERRCAYLYPGRANKRGDGGARPCTNGPSRTCIDEIKCGHGKAQ